MKSAKAYRSEFFVIHCPYCGYVHYLDIEDLYSDHVNAKTMDCKQCKKTFEIEEY